MRLFFVLSQMALLSVLPLARASAQLTPVDPLDQVFPEVADFSPSMFTGIPSDCAVVPVSDAACNGEAFRKTYCGAALEWAGYIEDTGLPVSHPCSAFCPSAVPNDRKDLCSNQIWLRSVCGAQELWRWRAKVDGVPSVDSTCANHAMTATGPSAVTKLALPPLKILDGHGFDCNGDGIDDERPCLVDEIPSPPPPGNFVGLTTAYQGARWRDSTYFPQTHTVKHPDYVDGPASASCEEYVYDLYWQYSLYEDQATMLADDWRGIFNVAYSPDDYGIARRLMYQDPLLTEDGYPIPEMFEQPSTTRTPRNVFFSVEIDNRFALDPFNNEVWTPEEANIAKLVNFGQNRNYWYVRGWSWHSYSSRDLAAKFTDDELLALEPLKDEYLQLVNKRNDVLDRIAAWWRAMYERAEQQPFQRPPWFDPSIWEREPDLYIYDSSLLAIDPISLSLNNQKAMQLGLPYQVPGSGAMSGGSAMMAGGSTMSSMNTSATGTTQGAALSVALPPVFGGPGCVTPVACMERPPPVAFRQAFQMGQLPERQLDLIDLQNLRIGIEKKMLGVLAIAEEFGCLDFDPNAPGEIGRCDWSPKEFVRMVSALVADGREQEYDRCQTWAVDFNKSIVNFEAICEDPAEQSCPGKHLKVWDKRDQIYRECEAGNYSKNTNDVDVALSCLAAQKAAANAKMRGDPRANLDCDCSWSLRDQRKDDFALDLGDFGVRAGYNVGYDIGKLNVKQSAPYENLPSLDELTPHAWASAYLWAKAFGHRTDVFDVDLDVHMSSGSGKSIFSFNVLGVEISMPHPNVDLSALDFDFVSESLTIRDPSDAIFSVSLHFSLGPIPLRVSAGVAGGVGLDTVLDTGTAKDLSGKWLSPNQAEALRLKTGFAPWAKASAFAEIAIDIYIASAGVRGDIVVADFRLPNKVEASFEPVPSGSGLEKLLMKIAANGQLSFGMLQGSVKVFVKVNYIFGSKTYSKNLFSWGGERWDRSLYSMADDFAIGLLLSPAELAALGCGF